MSTTPSIREALANLENQTDVIAACLIAGGTGPGDVPEDFPARWHLIGETPDARLALHALANVYHEAPPEVEHNPEWQEYREDHDAQAFMLDTWCTNIACMMPPQAMKRWLGTADQHPKMALELRDTHMSGIATEHGTPERLLAIAVQTATAEHQLRHGHPPGGDFALTILEATGQYQEELDSQRRKQQARLHAAVNPEN